MIVKLTKEQLQKIYDTLEYHNDEGPAHEGWQSPELEEIVSIIGGILEEEKEKEKPKPITDPCPRCGSQLNPMPRGGVDCPNCDYWFCF